MIQRLASAILATGSSQIFWFLSLPLIGKLYSQEDIGLYGQVVAYAATVGLIIGARSDLAVLVSPKGRVGVTRRAFERLALILTIPIGLIAFAIGLVSGSEVLKYPIIVVVLLGGYLSNQFILNGVSLVKADDYSTLRNSGLIRSASQTIAQLTMAPLGMVGLIGGKLVGDVVGVAWRRRKVLLDERVQGVQRRSAKAFSLHELAVIRRNAGAFKYSLPQSIVNSVTQNAPYFFLPIVLSSKEMGQFAMAFAIVVTPVGLIGSPVRQTFIAHFAAIPSDFHRSRRLLVGSTSILLLVGLACCATFYIGAEALVTVIFGEKWRSMSYYAQILAWWPAVGVASIPSVAYLLTKGRNKLHLRLELWTALARVGALVIGVFFLNGPLTLAPYVGVSIFFLVITMLCAIAESYKIRVAKEGV